MTKDKDQEIAELKARVASLEASPPTVTVYAPQQTPYERFKAEGGTDREWVKRQRRIAHMQNHY